MVTLSNSDEERQFNGAEISKNSRML